MVKTNPVFRYSISTDRTFGSDIVSREVWVIIENHPRSSDTAFEGLSVNDVKTLRDMCNQILEEVKYEDEKLKRSDSGK